MMSGSDKAENLAWQANKSIAECNRFMLSHELACDVEFAVGMTGDIIRAHKYMLVSRSPVFFAMFYGGLAVHQNAPHIIPDVTPEGFRAMLQFIYCDECTLSGENVLPVLYAGKKYLLPALTQLCAKFLEENLHVDNVCIIYEQCLHFDESAMLDKCRSFIETQTKEVFASDVFKDISRSTLENIMQFPSMSVSELSVFQACLAWSSKECHRQGIDVTPENQRSVLGSVLFHIRFPTMSLVEFAQEVSKTNVLTADDRCAVFEYIACQGDSCRCSENGDAKGATTSNAEIALIDLDLSPRLRFPTSPRKYPLPLILSRFTSFCKSGIYSGDCSMMRLRCDQQVDIRGFGVSGSMSDPLHELAVVIKQDRQIVCNQTVSVTDDMTGEPIKVFLSDPLLMQPAQWYTVIITFQFHGEREQGSCRRGKGGSKSVHSEGIIFEFDRCDSGSLIPEVLFSRAS